MKVLMINGSFRKKNTYNILLQIGEFLKEYDIESEILNLFDCKIEDCTGCDEICMEEKRCCIDDDMQTIMQKILDSDGIVFSSPVYRDGVTSQFKAFADRTNMWAHKPETVGKPALCVATTTVTGIKETLNFFDSFVTAMALRKGGFIARTEKTMNVSVGKKELSLFLSLLKNNKKYYRPSMNEIVIFEVLKVLALKHGGETQKFWEERKWLDKFYYYDCKMGLCKKLFSKMMFGILSKAMN